MIVTSTTARAFQPIADPRFYQTYSIRRPRATHWRKGTCEEARCEAFLNGWKTVIDTSTELGQKQAYYITHDKTRTPSLTQEGPIWTFTYQAGTTCFRKHEVPLAREPLFGVRDGDWRGNPTGRNQGLSVENWINDFREHEDHLDSIRKRG